MILVEAVAAYNDAGDTTTLYFSDDHFTTGPGDTPAHTAFWPVLENPGSLEISAFGDGRSGGSGRINVGEIVLNNMDGELDYLLDYSFGGRQVTIRSGTGGAYPADFPVVITATIDSVEPSLTNLIFQLTDLVYLLEEPACPTLFAGNNALPNGLEGTASDLKGKRKPRLYGKVFNIAPPVVNTSKHTYQVNDGPISSILAVYDGGVALTAGANYATSALLQAATVTGGTYATCLAEGYFRLGSKPAKQVTVDAQTGAAAANRTAAQLILQLAIESEVVSDPPHSVTSSDVSCMDLDNDAEVGVWSYGDYTYKDLMDKLADSVGAFYGFDGLGVLRMGILSAPVGSPAFTLYDDDIRGDIEPVEPQTRVPLWEISIDYARVWEVQPDLDVNTTAARIAFLRNEYRTATASDPSVKNKHKKAETASYVTYLLNEADAQAEADRRLALHSSPMAMYEVPVDLGIIEDHSPSIRTVVSLDIDRFGMAGGKLFRVLGIRTELASRIAVLTLWG